MQTNPSCPLSELEAGGSGLWRSSETSAAHKTDNVRRSFASHPCSHHPPPSFKLVVCNAPEEPSVAASRQRQEHACSKKSNPREAAGENARRRRRRSILRPHHLCPLRRSVCEGWDEQPEPVPWHPCTSPVPVGELESSHRPLEGKCRGCCRSLESQDHPATNTSTHSSARQLQQCTQHKALHRNRGPPPLSRPDSHNPEHLPLRSQPLPRPLAG